MDRLHDHAQASALGELSRFRHEFSASLTARSDALFELTDAVLCADGPVTSLVELTLVAEHRRGHGVMYDALNQGRGGCAAASRRCRCPGPATADPGLATYSFVVALETDRTSRTALLDGIRQDPADDATAVTAEQCARWSNG